MILSRAATAALLTAAATAGCSVPAPSASLPAVVPAPVAYQRGIDLDFYWHHGQDVTGLVTREASYARSLGANATIISFPVYTSGATVTAGTGTPTTAALAAAVRAARAQGLTVGVRPLLNEASLGHSREKFKPAAPAAWFTSYAAAVTPYARAVQASGAASFFTGTELTRFAHAPQWAQVTAAVRKVFSGRLYFAANWVGASDAKLVPGSGGPGVTVTTDAYPVTSAPVSQFTRAWASAVTELPPGTLLTEAGIAAQSGAQRHPYSKGTAALPLNPQVQAAWFKAACDAVATTRLGGIYFWVIYVGQSLTAAPATADAQQFTGSPGAAAVRGCFTELAAR